MIFTERTIKMSNDVCEIDNPIVLYRGDYNVEVRFTIIECPYKYTTKNSTNIIEAVNASYGQLVIRVPNGKPPIFSDTVETKGGSIVFTLSGEMIDEGVEVGDYTFQIRLFDADKESRATIPPVENGISIREPIASEDITDTSEVGIATVGYAITTATSDTLEVFDEEGNYIETVWGTGDIITANKLNKIEDGITGVNQKIESVATTIPDSTSDLTNDSGFITAADIPEVAVPTNVSQLTNDVGFITVDEVPVTDLTEYAKTEDIPVVPTNVSAFTNDASYVSETYVNNKIAEASLSGGEVDLSGYVTKEIGNADQITFADGETFQAKLENGTLKGEKGDTGEQGIQGERGLQGERGEQGIQGIQGEKGDQGEQGIQGIQGEQGPQGERGPQGLQGEQGPQGPAGADGADGLTTAISVNGTTYNHSNGTITLPNYPTVVTAANGITIADTANNFTATNVEGALAELFQSVSSGKTLIASAITDKGVATSNTDTFETMANNIASIITSTSSDDLILAYNFNNSDAGHAGGTISLTSTSSDNDGDYDIYWANDTTILSGYDAISTFTMSGDSSVQTYTFIDRTAIPVEATRIVALINDNIRASYTIPASKIFSGTKLYSFGLLSDVHVDGDGDDEASSNTDFETALQYFTDTENVDLVCTAGDMTRNGHSYDCEVYNNIINTYLTDIPIYTCRGNHDTLNECATLDYYMANVEPNGLYYQQTVNGDLFLFIGWHGDYQQPFSDEEITWLQPILEANRNVRVFLFIHPFLTSGTGNPSNLYPFQSAVCDITSGNALTFYEMMQHYRNVILFHGHSHFEFKLQRVDNDANCRPRTNSMCTEIHVPSSGNPRKNDEDTDDVYGNSYDYYPGSQGYICDVYENTIILRGRDFETNSFVPLAQYILDTTPVEIPAEGEETETTYTITNNLTNVTTSNSATSIAEGLDYTATLTANDGYTLDTVTVTVGGTDVTSTAYNDGTITVESVSGNIVITATATQEGGGSEEGGDAQLGELSIIWEAGTIGSDGSLTDQSNMFRTNAISVNPNYTYTITRNGGDFNSLCCYAYDSSNTFISRFGGNSGNYIQISSGSSYTLPDMPSNAAIIRFRATLTGGTTEDFNTVSVLTIVASN